MKKTLFSVLILCFLLLFNLSFASNNESLFITNKGMTGTLKSAQEDDVALIVKEAQQKFQATSLPVIIMTVDYKYLPVLLNAAVFLQRSDVLESLLLFCTDKKAKDEMER